MHRFCGVLLLMTASAIPALSQGPFASPQAPSVQISNNLIRATVFTPDATRGFYRGTRFDWAGVIGRLESGGHNYYGPWFTATDPKVYDFVYRGSDIVAGPCSAATGPVEEFFTNGKALGFDEAAPGGTFIKIGVGVLRRPDKADYSSYVLYDIVDGGTRTTEVHPSSIAFTQQVTDPTSGYGYRYEKTLRLIPGKPEMVIEHTLKNIGKRPIDSTVYDHNFLSIDGLGIGPDLHITFPFELRDNNPQDRSPNMTHGSIQGKTIRYSRGLQGNEGFETQLRGYGPTSSGYDVRIENTKVGAGVRFTGDRPLVNIELWSIRSVVAVEPFIQISIKPGESVSWHYTYSYYQSR
jgi:hypothetical protein